MTNLKIIIYKIFSLVTYGKVKQHCLQKIAKYSSQKKIFNNSFEEIKFQLKCIQRFLTLKELYPEIIESLKTESTPKFDKHIIGALNKEWKWDPYIRSISSWFCQEEEYLNSAMQLDAPGLEKSYPYSRIIKNYKNIIKKNLSNKYSCYNKLVFSKMFHADMDDELNDIFTKLENDENALLNISPITWLRYISFCVYKSNFEKASELLQKYCENFGFKSIKYFPPVAWIATKTGISNEKINKSALIFETIKNYNDLNLFEKKIKGKRVALVGNGPQEIGTANGKKIDQYDVVIRFNEFETDGDFAVDYGHKTDIWVRYIAVPDKPYDKFNSQCIIANIYMLLLNHPFNKDLYKDLYAYCKQKRELFSYPLEILHELKTTYSIFEPSSGLMMIYWIKKINPNFSPEDCYGFSFKELIQNSDWSCYFKRKLLAPHERNHHCLTKEQEIIKAIFNGK